jgi:hypothetical protein
VEFSGHDLLGWGMLKESAMKKDAPLRLFLQRAVECLVCLMAGWWLGAAGTQWLAWRPLTADAPSANGAEPVLATPSSIPPAQAAPFGLAQAGAGDAMESGELYPEWVEVPASFVTESEGVNFLGILNAVTAEDAQKKTTLWKDLLRLTPEEHERLAVVLRDRMTEWARLQISNMRQDSESPGYWRLAGDGERLRVLGERVREDIRRAIGPEKASLFSALAFKEMEYLLQPAHFVAREWPEGEFSLNSETKLGGRTIFFGNETFGAAGIIADEVKRLHQQQLREAAGRESLR